MCGLAGMAGNGVHLKHLEAYKELLYMSALRGRDGTGVLAVNTRPTKEILRNYKSTRESNDFLYDHGGKNGFLSWPTWNVLMGHTRWATVGGISPNNTHPFDVGSIVGAHNGTLQSIEFYDKKKTDSEVFFEMMQTKGMVPTLELTSWYDAWAFSVYTKGTGKITLGHNGQRPLAVGFCENSDVIFWASEYQMIHLVCQRNKIPVKVVVLASYRVYEIDIEEIKAGNDRPWTTTDIEHPKLVELPSEYRNHMNDKIPF